mgnify:CR=1 FL=1
MSAVTSNPPITGFPYISNAVRLSNVPGMTFGNVPVDNTARLQYAIDWAFSQNKFIELDYADRGPLCCSNGLLNLTASMYGNRGGPKPEIWFTANGAVSSAASVAGMFGKELSYFTIRRMRAEGRRLTSWVNNGGLITATFDTNDDEDQLGGPILWAVGDQLQSNDLPVGYAFGGAPVVTAVNVGGNPYSIQIYAGGVTRQGTCDLRDRVQVVGASRRNGRITYRLQAFDSLGRPYIHSYRPGMLIGFDWAQSPGGNYNNMRVLPRVAAFTETLRSFGSYVLNSDSTRRSVNITVGAASNYPQGSAVWASDGRIPPGALVSAASGTTITVLLNSMDPITLGGTFTLNRGSQSAEFSSAKAVVNTTSTTITVDSAGDPDLALTVGASVYIQRDVATNRARVHGLRAGATNGYAYGDTAHGSIGGSFYGKAYDVEVRGVGWMLFNSSGAEMHRCGCVNTVADGFFTHVSSAGQDGRFLMKDCYTNSTGDDGFAFVSNQGNGFSSNEIINEGGRVEYSNARGFVFSGAMNGTYRNGTARWTVAAGLYVESDLNSGFAISRAQNVRFIDMQIRGNGQGNGNLGPLASGIAVYGGGKIEFNNIQAQDANLNGMDIGSAGRLSMFDVVIRDAASVPLNIFNASGAHQVDIDIDKLTIEGGPGSGLFVSTSTARGRLKIKNLTLADLNTLEGFASRGLHVEGNQVQLELGEINWRKQGFFMNQPLMINNQTSVPRIQTRKQGDWQLPAGATQNLGVGQSGALAGDVVLVGNFTGTATFGQSAGNNQFTLTAEARDKGFYPHSILISNGGQTTQVTAPLNLAIYTDSAGAGTLLWAASNALRQCTEQFTARLVGRPPVSYKVSTVSGSAWLKFDAEYAPCDDITIGMDVSGPAGLPASSPYVAYVDRKEQVVCLTNSTNNVKIVNQIFLGNRTLTLSDTLAAVGENVTGDGIPTGSTIVSGGGTTTPMYGNAIASNAGGLNTRTGPATLTIGGKHDTVTLDTARSLQIVVADDLSAITNGMTVTGTGIPGATTVNGAVSGSLVTLSALPTVTGDIVNLLIGGVSYKGYSTLSRIVTVSSGAIALDNDIVKWISGGTNPLRPNVTVLSGGGTTTLTLSDPPIAASGSQVLSFGGRSYNVTLNVDTASVNTVNGVANGTTSNNGMTSGVAYDCYGAGLPEGATITYTAPTVVSVKMAAVVAAGGAGQTGTLTINAIAYAGCTWNQGSDIASVGSATGATAFTDISIGKTITGTNVASTILGVAATLNANATANSTTVTLTVNGTAQSNCVTVSGSPIVYTNTIANQAGFTVAGTGVPVGVVIIPTSGVRQVAFSTPPLLASAGLATSTLGQELCIYTKANCVSSGSGTATFVAMNPQAVATPVRSAFAVTATATIGGLNGATTVNLYGVLGQVSLSPVQTATISAGSLSVISPDARDTVADATASLVGANLTITNTATTAQIGDTLEIRLKKDGSASLWTLSYGTQFKGTTLVAFDITASQFIYLLFKWNGTQWVELSAKKFV